MVIISMVRRRRNGSFRSYFASFSYSTWLLRLEGLGKSGSTTDGRRLFSRSALLALFLFLLLSIVRERVVVCMLEDLFRIVDRASLPLLCLFEHRKVIHVNRVC